MSFVHHTTIFLLGNHITSLNGYTLICPISNEDISTLVCSKSFMTRDDKKTITIEAGAGINGKEVLNLADWKTKSRNYFNRYYKASNIISTPTDMDMIMSTLHEMCFHNRSRGFLIKDYDIAKHLKFLGYDEDNLNRKLNIAQKNSIIPYLVYIERKQVVLICDKIVSGSNKIQCMENVVASMKCFLTLYNNEIQLTDVTVIGLLIRENDKVDELIKCNFCKLFSPSFEVFKSVTSCINWWNSVETYNSWWDLSKLTKSSKLFEHLVAEILPFMALQKKYNNLPSITNNVCQQFEQTCLLFTPQQMDIYLSDTKHIVIQGSYGSGKSILGLKKLEMIAKDKSTQYQKIIYINFDSKCELHIKMEIDVRKYARISSRKIKLTDSIQEIFKSPDALISVFHNSAGENLSTILQDIIKHQKMGTSEKREVNVHVIIEEYDGESLTHIEAARIKNLIKDNFEKSYIMILAQPLKKQRSWNAGEECFKKETCMFQELKSAFKIVKLQKVLRSSNEITQITKSVQTFVGNKDSIYVTEIDGLKFEQKQKSADIKQHRVSCNVKTSNDPEKALNYKNNISSTYSNNSSVKSNKGHDDTMDLDQALELTSSLENGTGKNVIKSSFSFVCVPRKGVEITGDKPKLYEFSGDIHSASDMAVIFLALVLADITNEHKKTVLLHMSEEKPDILEKAILLLPRRLGNVFCTESIKDYTQSDRPGKTILSSSFRRVNGMEFDHVVIFVSYSEYYLKYYLPQVISRCTYDLNFVLLPKENQERENDKLIDSKETVAGLIGEIKQKCLAIQLDIVECQTCEEDDEILVDYISEETDKKLFRVHTHSDQYIEYADQYNECLTEVTENKESREQSADSSARAKAR